MFMRFGLDKVQGDSVVLEKITEFWVFRNDCDISPL